MQHCIADVFAGYGVYPIYYPIKLNNFVCKNIILIRAISLKWKFATKMTLGTTCKFKV